MSKLIIPKQSTRISLNFFKRHAYEVVKDLLGRVLVKERAGKLPIYLRFEEVAAYEGEMKSMAKGVLESPGTIGVSTKFGKYLIDISTLEICEHSCVTLIGGSVFDARGLREIVDGPGKLSKALEIDRSYDGVPLNFAKIWIGGYPIDSSQIIKRNKSNVPDNCLGYFYYKPE